MSDAEGKRTLSIILPDSTYDRVTKLARHERFRKMNQVIRECVRRSLDDLEREYPIMEEVGARQ